MDFWKLLDFRKLLDFWKILIFGKFWIFGAILDFLSIVFGFLGDFFISLTRYPIILPLCGSDGLSARRTMSSRPKAGPKGRQLEVGS